MKETESAWCIRKLVRDYGTECVNRASLYTLGYPASWMHTQTEAQTLREAMEHVRI